MTNIMDSIYRIATYYNTNTDFDIEGITAKTIVSLPLTDPYQNTCASFMSKMPFIGTPGRAVILEDDEKITIHRYEPILSITTVFTGNNAQQNAALHYPRMREMLSAYEDMSLIGKTDFKDASISWEGSYLQRMQSNATYLAFFDIQSTEPYITSLDELLNAYPDNTFTHLLTQREIIVEES